MEKINKDGILTIVIDGLELRTKEQLMTTMKEALSLPEYFGMNWDALDEAFKDLSWLDSVNSISISIMNSHQILADESLFIEKERKIFRQILEDATNYWKNEDYELGFCVEYK